MGARYFKMMLKMNFHTSCPTSLHVVFPCLSCSRFEGRKLGDYICTERKSFWRPFSCSKLSHLCVFVTQFSIGCPKSRLSQRLNRTKVYIVISQWELKTAQARENANDQVTILLSLAFDWLRGWHDSSRPITEQS